MKIGDIINGAIKIKEKGEVIRDRTNLNESRQRTEISSPVETSKDSVTLKIREFARQAIEGSEKYPDVREDRVRELQNKIREGTYQISNRDLARAMLRSILSEIS